MDVQYTRSTHTVVFGIRSHAYKPLAIYATQSIRTPARPPAEYIHRHAARPGFGTHARA